MIDRKIETIADNIQSISSDIAEFKSTQQAGGKSFVNYSVSSSNNYDFALTMNTANKTFRVTFTHELSDKYNIVDLSWFMKIDNQNVMDNPRLSNATPFTTEVCYEMPQLGKTTWLLDCGNIDWSVYPAVNTHIYYFKFYFNGTTSGMYSVTAL